MGKNNNDQDQRAGAEIVYGAEECYRHSVELLEELGFPKGVFPLKDLEECGIVRETGFVWMKQKKPFEHYHAGTKSRGHYSMEVTAYVEKFRMKKITGIKSKLGLLWIPVSEMSIDDPKSKKVIFRTPMGIGKAFPFSAFDEVDDMEEEKVEKINIHSSDE